MKKRVFALFTAMFLLCRKILFKAVTGALMGNIFPVNLQFSHILFFQKHICLIFLSDVTFRLLPPFTV